MVFSWRKCLALTVKVLTRDDTWAWLPIASLGYLVSNLCIANIDLVKVSCFRNVFLVSSISSKKRTKTRLIVVKTNSFVCFLEEFTAWQFAFKIIWPLGIDEKWENLNFEKSTLMTNTKVLHKFWASKNSNWVLKKIAVKKILSLKNADRQVAAIYLGYFLRKFISIILF